MNQPSISLLPSFSSLKRLTFLSSAPRKSSHQVFYIHWHLIFITLPMKHYVPYFYKCWGLQPIAGVSLSALGHAAMNGSARLDSGRLESLLLPPILHGVPPQTTPQKKPDQELPAFGFKEEAPKRGRETQDGKHKGPINKLRHSVGMEEKRAFLPNVSMEPETGPTTSRYQPSVLPPSPHFQRYISVVI